MNSEALSLSRIDVEKYPALTWNPFPWMHEVSRPPVLCFGRGGAYLQA